MSFQVMFKASQIHEPSEELLKNVAKKIDLDMTDADITVCKGKPTGQTVICISLHNGHYCDN